MLAAGCGGGPGGGGPTVASQAHTTTAGDAVITYFGQPKPLITASSNSVSALGQAGATFSTVVLQPAPNMDSTSLVIGRDMGEQTGIYRVSYPYGNSQLLYQNEGNDTGPGASVYGNIAFTDSLEGNNLGSVRIDGTGFTGISLSEAGGGFRPRYATDGTNRLSMSGDGNLYVLAGSGGAETLVQSNSAGYGGAWNPTGTKLIYSAYISGDSISDLYETSPTGGTASDMSPGPLEGAGNFQDVSWSPDGMSVAAAYTPAVSSLSTIVLYNLNNRTSYASVTPSGDSDESPVFSPDGTKIAFYRTDANSQTPGIYVMDANGLNSELFSADPPSARNSGEGLTWTPFLPKETVVAATGSTFYHQAASGFLLDQVGDQFGSFVAFTATTPSAAAIQAPAGNSGSAPMIFTITADAITSIAYTNSYFNPVTTLTLSSTPTVVVSVDSITGQIDVVAPASVSKPTLVKNADGTVSYKAPFKAVYDGKGNNLAPNGATSLTLNPKSGKLVTFKQFGSAAR